MSVPEIVQYGSANATNIGTDSVFKVITCFIELQAEREREEEERRKAEEEMLKEMAEQERLEYERKKAEEEEQRRLQEEQDRYFINDIVSCFLFL